jgi:hypothetical protein
VITERALTGIEAKPSFDETVRIMDEMERLLAEMKEMMSIIKGIVGDEPEGQAYSASINDRAALSRAGNVIRGS